MQPHILDSVLSCSARRQGQHSHDRDIQLIIADLAHEK